MKFCEGVRVSLSRCAESVRLKADKPSVRVFAGAIDPPEATASASVLRANRIGMDRITDTKAR